MSSEGEDNSAGISRSRGSNSVMLLLLEAYLGGAEGKTLLASRALQTLYETEISNSTAFNSPIFNK